jgi:two-component system, LytTR family, response regulator
MSAARARPIATIIVDDEPLARRGVRQLLAPHDDFAVVAECRNGGEAVRAIRALAPDLAFLDVQMPGMGGLDVVREIGVAAMPDVVFVTAYDEYAVRAFETRALDYLVKPIGAARFNEALDRVRQRGRERDALARAAARAARETVAVPTAQGVAVLDVDEIDWIEADDYYAAIHARGRRLLLRESLASLERRLPRGRFVRAHRSALVAVDRIVELRGGTSGGVTLLLRGGRAVPVSRRRREEVVAALRGSTRLP